MKKLITLFLVFLLFFSSINLGFTFEIKAISEKKTEKKVSREEIFNFFGDYFKGKIPKSYEYIDLKFIDIKEENTLYKSLQSLVYLNLIKNTEKKLYPSKPLNSYYFFKLSENIFGLDIVFKRNKKRLSKNYTTKKDLDIVKYALSSRLSNFKISNRKEKLNQQKSIFLDVYRTILDSHYDRENIDEKDIIYSAIEGIANGSGDKYTTYFPPSDNKNFIESLDGKYEGIGAYIDIEKPGEVKIISPIVGGPAEKAGLMGGDIVIGVDGVKVKKNNSLKEVISRIKGPSGTQVELEIKRGGDVFKIKIIRAEIVLNDIEYKLIKKDTFYIQIKNFGSNVSSDFKKSLEYLKNKKSVKKIIIDLRNNSGGYLDQVTDMLSYFVEKGKPIAVVKYKSGSKNYNSKAYKIIDFSKYKIVILQNSGTASASEIMIGTIKDYYPDLILIGTKTYGKGSVQTIKPYSDGSTLKYTIAKWFTGKSKTGIDSVGIEPDLKIEFDVEQYKEDGSDNQLDEALNIDNIKRF